MIVSFKGDLFELPRLPTDARQQILEGTGKSLLNHITKPALIYRFELFLYLLNMSVMGIWSPVAGFFLQPLRLDQLICIKPVYDSVVPVLLVSEQIFFNTKEVGNAY